MVHFFSVCFLTFEVRSGSFYMILGEAENGANFVEKVFALLPRMEVFFVF